MSDRYLCKFTPLADDDIDSALRYISVELCNPKAAVDLFDDIAKTIENIRSFPFSSSSCADFFVSDETIRHVPVDNFYLFYEIKEDEKQINVLRFRFSRMDFSKMSLREDK